MLPDVPWGHSALWLRTTGLMGQRDAAILNRSPISRGTLGTTERYRQNRAGPAGGRSLQFKWVIASLGLPGGGIKDLGEKFGIWGSWRQVQS